jgi:hypothetical protein
MFLPLPADSILLYYVQAPSIMLCVCVWGGGHVRMCRFPFTALKIEATCSSKYRLTFARLHSVISQKRRLFIIDLSSVTVFALLQAREWAEMESTVTCM